MSDMPPVSEEVVVYGDAPEDEGGGGTDTISIPVDFLTFYVPAGPTIINPPPPTGGGGGGDVVDPKEEFGEAEEKAIWIAAGLATVAVLQPETAVVTGIAAAAFGVAGWYLGNAADDPPQPNYQRPAGSTIPKRKLALPGPASADTATRAILAVELTTAVFVDAMECAQGAFIAGDAPWTQRHSLAARDAYGECGRALLAAADTLAVVGRPLKGQPAPANVGGQWPAVLASVRPVLGLTAADEAHLTDTVVPALSLGVPSQADVTKAVDVIRHLGQRLTKPVMIDARFEFVKNRPKAG